MIGVALPTRPALAPSSRTRGPVAARPVDLRPFYRVQLFALIFLQKLGIPVGPGGISIPLLVLYAGIALLGFRGALRVSGTRLLLVALLVAAASSGQAMVGAPISPLSLGLFLTLYGPWCFVWDLHPAQYRALTDIYGGYMLVAAAALCGQSAWASATGQVLSLEAVLPGAILLPGYLYEAPFAADGFVRPNGLVFLEPSYASAFLAAALLIELAGRRRPWRLGLFAGALAGSMGATGLAMLAAALPFSVAALPPGWRLRLLAVAAAGAVAAASSGVAERLGVRLDEFAVPTSSASIRLVQPLARLLDLAEGSGHLVTGAGAGNTDTSEASVWAFAKAWNEYGLATALLLLGLYGTAVAGTRQWPLVVALSVMFHLTGGYLLNPIAVMLVLLLCCFPRLPPEGPPRHAGGRRR